MRGALIGWAIGAILSLITVMAIPGDQGIWAFLIGFLFSFAGFHIGGYLEDNSKWSR